MDLPAASSSTLRPAGPRPSSTSTPSAARPPARTPSWPPSTAPPPPPASATSALRTPPSRSSPPRPTATSRSAPACGSMWGGLRGAPWSRSLLQQTPARPRRGRACARGRTTWLRRGGALAPSRLCGRGRPAGPTATCRSRPAWRRRLRRTRAAPSTVSRAPPAAAPLITGAGSGDMILALGAGGPLR